MGLVLDMDHRCLDYFVNRRFKARIASQLPHGALSFHVQRRALAPMHSVARAHGQTQTDLFADSGLFKGRHTEEDRKCLRYHSLYL